MTETRAWGLTFETHFQTLYLSPEMPGVFFKCTLFEGVNYFLLGGLVEGLGGLMVGFVLGNHEDARRVALLVAWETQMGFFRSGEFGSLRVGTVVF